MTAKRLTLALLFALAPLAAHAQNLLTFAGDPGGTYCVLFTDAENTAVDFSESAQAGHFAIADSALVTAGLDASATPYAARVYARAASGLNPTTHADLWVSTIYGIRWNGTSTLTDEQALLATSTTGSPASNTVHQVLQWLRAAFTSSGVYSAPALANAPSGEGTEPDDRDLEPVQHVWRLRRTADGTLRSTNPLYVHPGDGPVRAGWDCSIPNVLPAGTIISTQNTPTEVTATDDIDVTAIGHDATLAKVELDIAADAEATDDPATSAVEGHWIKTTVTNTNGGTVTVYGQVVIMAEPE